MANYNTEFSFMIPLADDQRAWGDEVVAFLEAAQEDPAVNPAHPLFKLLPVDFVDDEILGYEIEALDEGLWISDDAGEGEPSNLVPLITAYLARFDPGGTLGFTWADTCSKHRVGAFSGGAVHVTASAHTSMHASDWLYQQSEEAS